MDDFPAGIGAIVAGVVAGALVSGAVIIGAVLVMWAIFSTAI